MENNFSNDKIFEARIVFATQRPEVIIPNLNHDQYQSLKTNIWVRGVAVFHDPDTCEIVSPLQIAQVLVRIQAVKTI